MAPVTLRLKSGSGPVTVNGLHLVGMLEVQRSAFDILDCDLFFACFCP